MVIFFMFCTVGVACLFFYGVVDRVCTCIENKNKKQWQELKDKLKEKKDYVN